MLNKRVFRSFTKQPTDFRRSFEVGDACDGLSLFQGLCPSSRLSAANGQSVPAVEVFSQALRFFRDRVLQEIGDQDSTGAGGGGGCGGEGGIRWVITVPVIWTKEAKQFMRLAAYKVRGHFPLALLISRPF